jgi:hypothetical protein
MDTGNRMSRASRKDYLRRIYPRCQRASRPQTQGILDELCANCSYHRKHTIRLLNRSLPAAKTAPRRRARGRTYGPQVISFYGLHASGSRPADPAVSPDVACGWLTFNFLAKASSPSL